MPGFAIHCQKLRLLRKGFCSWKRKQNLSWDSYRWKEKFPYKFLFLSFSLSGGSKKAQSTNFKFKRSLQFSIKKILYPVSICTITTTCPKATVHSPGQYPLYAQVRKGINKQPEKRSSMLIRRDFTQTQDIVTSPARNSVASEEWVTRNWGEVIDNWFVIFVFLNIMFLCIVCNKFILPIIMFITIVSPS